MGGWVGEVEEIEAVGMSYCKGGFVWVGGWVEEGGGRRGGGRIGGR